MLFLLVAFLLALFITIWYITYTRRANLHSSNADHFFEPEKGVHLYYRLFGSGPRRVFFVVGLGTNYMYWYPQVSFVSKTKLPIAQEYTICVLDNRGAGNSYVFKQMIKN